MRLDFNPSRSPEGFAPILRALNAAIPDFSMDSLVSGNATRVDIAFDVYGVDMEMIDALCRLRLRETTRYRTADARTFDRYGALNAIVIGAKDVPSRLRIYDKKLQLEMTRTGALRICRSRVRCELQERGWGPTVSVGTRENPFLRYRLYQHDLLALQAPRSTVEQLFRDAIQWRGAVGVLSQIADQRERRQYEQLLRPTAGPAYWNPDALWVEFRHAWQRLINLGNLQSIAN